VYLTKEKTLRRKAQQIVLALLIEAFHTKEEILEAYLRSLDFGLEEGGLEFASHRYFGKPSRELTYTEALKLAISVPSPKLYNPSMPMNEHSWRLARKVTQGLERYGYLIDLDFMDAWRDQPVLPSASHD
jgi:penicillin-binding protein 1A